MIFPYIEFMGRFEERVLRPMIPVQFSFKDESYTDYGMVDSGSDDTILPMSVAVKLGVNLSKLQSYSVCGAGGNIFNTYRAPSEIKITLKRKKCKTVTLDSKVYFSEAEGAILLGQTGFLNKLKVTLRGSKKEIQITA